MMSKVDSLGKLILIPGQTVTVTHETAVHRGLRGVVKSYDSRMELYHIVFENLTQASYTRDDFVLGNGSKVK